MKKIVGIIIMLVGFCACSDTISEKEENKPIGKEDIAKIFEKYNVEFEFIEDDGFDDQEEIATLEELDEYVQWFSTMQSSMKPLTNPDQPTAEPGFVNNTEIPLSQRVDSMVKWSLEGNFFFDVTEIAEDERGNQRVVYSRSVPTDSIAYYMKAFEEKE